MPDAAITARRSRVTLAAFYFVLLGANGLLVPFWALHCSNLGYSVQQIGVITALGPLSRCLFPAPWGYLTDRLGGRHRILILCSAACTVLWAAVLGVAPTGKLPLLLLALAAFSFFQTPIMPLVDAAILQEADRHRFEFGPVRVWGSVGFITMAIVGGLMADWKSVRGDAVAAVTFWPLAMAIGAYGAQTLVGLKFPRLEVKQTMHTGRRALGAALRNRAVLMLLTCGLLMQVSHAVFYGFFAIHMNAAGYSKTWVSTFFTIGVVAEIIVLYYAAPLVRRFGPEKLLLFSLFAAAARWTVYAWTTALPAVLLMQTFHAFTFGTNYIAAVALVHREFPDSLKNSGQGLYATASWGLGGSLGLLTAGVLFGKSPSLAFGVSAAVALAGGLIALAMLPGRRTN